MTFAYRKTVIFVTAFIFFSFFVRPAHSINERLYLSQSVNGELIANLSGSLYHCTIGFVNTSIANPIPGEFLVSTTIKQLYCPPKPDDQPFPYSLTANLGSLPDGNYKITWDFVDVFGNPQPSPVLSQEFLIRSGKLVSSPLSVPSVNEWGIIIFTASAGIGSIYFLRRRRVQT